MSTDWFTTQVKKQLANVSDKYFPDLHTQTSVDFLVHCVLGDKYFVEALIRIQKEIALDIREANELLSELRKSATIKKWGHDVDIFFELARNLNDCVKEALDYLAHHIRLVRLSKIEKARRTDFADIIDRITLLLEKCYKSYHSLYDKKVRTEETSSKEKENEKERAERALNKIYRPLSVIDEIIDKFHQFSKYQVDFKRSFLNIFGEAGIGKTHISCNICNERVQNGLPAILLHGGHFGTDQIESKVKEICDIPVSYSWSVFFATLEAYAEAHATKLPIVIDALNEATDTTVWRNQLGGFISQFENSPWLVLITNCRSTYRVALWGNKNSDNFVDAYGFHGANLQEALKKYFDHYKIKADITLAPLQQFEHPLYLKIFCETQNPDRQCDKEVYLGEQTLFSVFDQFLAKTNETISCRLSKPPSIPFVQRTLNELALKLWNENTRHLPLEEATKLFDDKSVHDLDWDNSITKALLDEGLLVTRDWFEQGEVLSFTYDLLGGYLISNAIFQNIESKNLRSYINSKEFKDKLLSKDYQKLYPLHEDILRCFCAMLPQKSEAHLYQLTKNKTAFSYSIDSLFEMDVNHIGNQQKELLKKLFKVRKNRQIFFKRARYNAFNLNHPLNIMFWDELMRQMSMSERDVSWTEYVRINSHEMREDIDNFIDSCNSEGPTSELVKQRLALAARYYSWILTSTHRMLRDTATLALVKFGKRFPKQLFELTLDFFSINDPYVPERMLAASYGVTMYLHARPNEQHFREEKLPKYAKSLYEKMFANGAPHSTTHVFMRDFARHTIDIALIYRPNLLSKRQKKRVTPPYFDGGIRNWKRSQDLNEGEYREGNAPLGMDFRNYTLGRLVPKRYNYDMKNLSYRIVRSNIFWRIYDLGYSFDKFGALDKQIVRSQYSLSRHEDNATRIDRYGKKYSWIAYYELYGHRLDKGYLKDSWRHKEPRPSEIDIDPSFPDEPHNIKILSMDFLGNRSISLNDWIQKGAMPDFSPYLLMKTVDKEKGTWVLLDGFALQEQKSVQRRSFAFLRSFMIKSDRYDDFLEHLKKQYLGNRWLPEVPEDHYTFAGEIPWCETFLENGISNIEFEVSNRIKKIKNKKLVFTKNGKKLPDHEIYSITQQVESFGPDKEQFVSELAKILDKEKVEVEIVEEIVNQKESVKKCFKVLIPVTENNWEAYHSGVNPGQHATVPAKEIALSLNLNIGLPTWDLYDSNWKRASITTRWGEAWKTNHGFCYLRDDLLERYLKKNKMKLVWMIWGEREAHFDIYERKTNKPELAEYYKVFSKILVLENGNVVPV